MACIDFPLNPSEGEYYPTPGDVVSATHQYTAGGWKIVKHNFSLVSDSPGVIDIVDDGNNGYTIAFTPLGGGDAFLAGTQTFTGVNTFSNNANTYAYDPSTSGLTATELGAAVDEVDGNVDALTVVVGTANSDITALETTVADIVAGTWSPTVTGITDYLDSTVDKAFYQRIGNIVSFTIKMQARPSSGPTTFTFLLSLPVASDFDDTDDVAGLGFDYTDNLPVASMSASTSSDEIVVQVTADDIEHYELRLVGSYEIK